VRSATNRTSRKLALVAGALLACALVSGTAFSQTEWEAPADEDVAAAIEKLRADPNLSGVRQVRKLGWRSEQKPQERSNFLQWLWGFFEWLGRAGRLLVWAIGGVLALLLAWSVIKMLRGIRAPGAPPAPALPTHVRDLDIRPESLPDDIGAAALELWRNGQHRAALALLYRGLLSKLAHTYRLPIRDSTTEGDCVALAATHLPPRQRDYVSQLVSVWQRTTYGGREPQDHEVETLCADFGSALTPSTDAERAP
jgi:hypothetical protein